MTNGAVKQSAHAPTTLMTSSECNAVNVTASDVNYGTTNNMVTNATPVSSIVDVGCTHDDDDDDDADDAS